MKTVWKFPFEVDDTFTIDMPQGARPLSVQTQDGKPCMWVVVDPDAPKKPRHFVLVGTGHPLPDDPLVFVGTFQMRDGALIFHVFENVQDAMYVARLKYGK